MLLVLFCSAQPAGKLITEIKKAQQNLAAISYRLLRTDSFVTGQSRIIQGSATLSLLPNDTMFGFAFRGMREGFNSFTVYDGKMGYDVDDSTKQYTTRIGQDIPHLLGSPGGQMIFEDLGKLDTTGAIRFDVREDDANYYLTMFYPDITEYDVTHRYKYLQIDKRLMLPVLLRKYQQTLGKVQHLKWEASNIKLNEQAIPFDFSILAFLDDYKHNIPVAGKSVNALKETVAPEFSLLSLAGERVSTSSFSGKVVLLDFWEVWCGPCVASMPKVDALYSKYKDKGLQVFGITNEPDQIESARKLLAKMKPGFPTLIGNKSIESTFKVTAIPLYVLIDRKGIITFVSQGFSEKIDLEIQKALL